MSFPSSVKRAVLSVINAPNVKVVRIYLFNDLVDSKEVPGRIKKHIVRSAVDVMMTFNFFGRGKRIDGYPARISLN